MTRAAPPVRPMSTADLLDRLERFYCRPTETLPGGVCVREVSMNGVAHGTQLRRCDLIYVGFTNASGRIMVGHEVKTGRGDWLKELDQPDKSDMWADACHAWYVVAPSTAIVHPEEIPHGWGLRVPDPRGKVRFTTVVEAQVKLAHNPPWWAVRSVMARADTLRATQIEKQVQTEIAKRVAEAVGAHMRRNPDESAQIVKAFADAGVRLAQYDEGGTSLAPSMITPEIVKALHVGGDLQHIRSLILRQYRVFADALSELETVEATA